MNFDNANDALSSLVAIEKQISSKYGIDERSVRLLLSGVILRQETKLLHEWGQAFWAYISLRDCRSEGL